MRQLKGWSQIVVDEEQERVTIGYVVDLDDVNTTFDYRSFWLTNDFTDICPPQ
jgi:hypothetical protein